MSERERERGERRDERGERGERREREMMFVLLIVLISYVVKPLVMQKKVLWEFTEVKGVA